MAEEKERHLTAPQVFDKETRIARIYEMILHGKTSTRQIAQELGITEEAVTMQMNKDRQRMSIFRQEMIDRYDDLTLARVEWLLSRLLPIVDAQIENTPLSGPSRDLMKQILELMKFGSEIAHPKISGGGEDKSKVTINQTFVTGSEMYTEALQQMQNDFVGYTVHEVEEPTIIIQNENLARIEELSSKYFPEGLEDGIPSDDDPES